MNDESRRQRRLFCLLANAASTQQLSSPRRRGPIHRSRYEKGGVCCFLRAAHQWRM